MGFSKHYSWWWAIIFCLGKNTKEKDVALAIALKLGDYIKKNVKGVKVTYTRDKDVFVELHKRAKIANDNKADLFISIHCNYISNMEEVRKLQELD